MFFNAPLQQPNLYTTVPTFFPVFSFRTFRTLLCFSISPPSLKSLISLSEVE